MSALVSLTYDDALAVHRTHVAPALAARGMRGTFYVPAAAGDLHEHIADWRAVAEAGHELGNHTCWHPCRGRPTWLTPTYHLENYSRQRIRDEVLMANRVLHLIDGRTTRSFAATCGNLTCGEGDESFLDDLRPLACAVRWGAAEKAITGPTPYLINAVRGDGKTADDLIAASASLLTQPDAWMTVLFHGVGAETHGLFISEMEHTRYLDWLFSQRQLIAVVPVVEAVARR